ncbi:serine/threonine/dual specificity protein kinase, catalytic domain-containing protein [Artemisia annua]|uniref:Serine/threonine/dual specificity protein kinase, catalytic domain-containing protein n=1 Tax=Artemisia annua TaxID=35608 RepID=A0A2U1LEC2_ARTAN|nr:serine/threonine/dual specificity protein kinase, catalytic domain-containing protein [Artemisia annua]
MALVYEYMHNGTLSDHLHKKGTSLSWLQRLKTCLGTARELHYLHIGTGTQYGVIHCRPTRKACVYAFGVVLLEVLCGRPTLDESLDEGLTVWAQDPVPTLVIEVEVDHRDPPEAISINGDANINEIRLLQ